VLYELHFTDTNFVVKASRPPSAPGARRQAKGKRQISVRGKKECKQTRQINCSTPGFIVAILTGNC
jgi:hypothetical protein